MTAIELVERLIAFACVSGAITYMAVIFSVSRDAAASRHCPYTYYAFAETIPPRWMRLISLSVSAICAVAFYSADLPLASAAVIASGLVIHVTAICARNVGRKLGIDV